MPPTRQHFREFLLRLADNNLRADDWHTFVMSRSSDETVEQVRLEIVERSAGLSDWQFGWIPRGLQDFARSMAVSLDHLFGDSISYDTESSSIEDDATISIPSSWSEIFAIASGVRLIQIDHPEYDFWKWLVSHPVLRKGRKSKSDIEAMKAKYLSRQ